MLVLSGCSGTSSEVAASSDVTAPALHRGDFQRELLLTGELEAVQSLSIKSPQTSQFQMRIQFMAEEGSIVEPGEPLVDFDNSSLADQVRTLEIQIPRSRDPDRHRPQRAGQLAERPGDRAGRSGVRGKPGRARGVDRPCRRLAQEYSERKLTHEKAERELNETQGRIELTRKRGTARLEVLEIERDKLQKDLISAETDLNLLSIKAPAQGLVVYQKRPQTTLRFQEGDSCWPGQEVIQLPDLSEMQVVFWVNEVDAPLLEVGDSVRVNLDAFPGRALEGTVRLVPSMAVRRSPTSKIAMFKVIATLSETWVGEMKPGMSTLGRLVIEDREDAPLVARAAVSFDGETYRLLTDEREIHPVARNESDYLLTEEEFADLSGARPPRGEHLPIQERVVKKSLKIVIPLLVLAVVLIAALPLMGSASSDETAACERGDIALTVEANGTLEAAVAYEIGPPSIRGFWEYSLSWMIPEGSIVKKGDVIARFDATRSRTVCASTRQRLKRRNRNSKRKSASWT